MADIFSALQNIEEETVTPQQRAMAQLQQINQGGILGGSALNLGDRFKYGFADEGGKLALLSQAGYKIGGNDLGSVIKLNNGEYGVRTENGIKPVDPKGFQLSDLASDLTESIGKAIPTVGAAVGGLLGSVPAIVTAGAATPAAIAGSVAGGTGGEALRQKIGEKLNVRAEGFQKEDLMEIAAEGLFSGVGEGVGRVVAGKLASVGAKKMAASQLDDIATGSLSPTVLSKADDAFGVNNDYLSERLLTGKSRVLDGSMSEDAIMQGTRKLEKTIIDGQAKAGQNYKANLVKNFGENYEQSLQFNTAKLVPSLSEDIAKLELKDIAGQNKTVVNQLKTLLENTKNKPSISLNEMKVASDAIEQLKASTFINGKPTSLTRDIGKLQSKILAVKNENPLFSEINKQYAKEMNLLNGLQNTSRIKLKQGELVEGMRDPAKMLTRLKDEYGASKLARMDKIQSQLRELGHDADFMDDLADGLLTDILKKQTKIPSTGFGITPKGIAKQLSDLIGNNALTRARMISGIAKTNPEILNKEVGKYLGTTQAMANLFMQKMPTMKLPGMPEPVKQTIGFVAKNANSKLGKRLAVQAATRQTKSLNDLLYGGSN